VPDTSSGQRVRLLWPLLAAPGMVWMALLFVTPLYVVLAIVFGQIDPVFRSPLPAWLPWEWDFTQFNFVIDHVFGADGYFGPALVRTAVYVVVASSMCVLIAYPVAYYTARCAGRYKALILTLLIAPFWISYMMRMLAWVNLLQDDGLATRAISALTLFPSGFGQLNGQASTVVLGLVYGYVPYMILPLFAGLDRIRAATLEAARDLGASRLEAFRRVTLPLSRPAIVAGVLLTCLPMLGDYFTNDLLSGSPRTTTAGNLINNSATTAGQTGQAGAFVLIVLLVALVPMLLFVRTTRDPSAVRS